MDAPIFSLIYLFITQVPITTPLGPTARSAQVHLPSRCTAQATTLDYRPSDYTYLVVGTTLIQPSTSSHRARSDDAPPSLSDTAPQPHHVVDLVAPVLTERVTLAGPLGFSHLFTSQRRCAPTVRSTILAFEARLCANS